jgi:hypothetical protein
MSFPQEGGKSAVECKVRRATASEPCNPSRAGSIGPPRMNVDQAAMFLQTLNCKQIRRKSNNWVSAHLASCGYSRSTGRRELRRYLSGAGSSPRTWLGRENSAAGSDSARRSFGEWRARRCKCMPRERGRILAKKKGARVAPRPKARGGQSRYFTPTMKVMDAGLYARLILNV